MKSRRSARKRRFSNTPSMATWSSVRNTGASSSPEMVRQGLNHSHPAVSVPSRASTPSETASTALKVNREGSSAR